MKKQQLSNQPKMSVNSWGSRQLTNTRMKETTIGIHYQKTAMQNKKARYVFTRSSYQFNLCLLTVTWQYRMKRVSS
jgi:outer membrane receptor protein involved in Fe transport